MDGGHRRYVVDASSWISIEKSPAHNLILYCVGQLIEDGKILCPPEAWDEVKRCPKVKGWIDQYRDKFVRIITTVEYLQTVGRVTGKFPMMAGARRRKERADQYVLAMASYLNVKTNPSVHCVVCEETAAQRASRKLVTACDAFDVRHMNLIAMLREEFPDEKWP
jgi:hypothetical protein